MASEDELLTVHTADYVRIIREYASGARERGDDFRYVNADTSIASNTYELASLAAGAMFAGIDAVLDGTVHNAIVLARPGDHHAYPERGEGFCIFNHTALAARYAQRQLGLERVMIIDWDLHHGNGTQAIFYSDPTVFTFSSHAYGAIYPRSGHETERGAGAGRGTTLNVPLPVGTRDRQYLEAFRKALRSVRFAPELVLLVAGFDGHEEDPMHGLRLSDAAFPILTQEVMDFAERACGGRLVSLVAGGYNAATIGRLVGRHVADLAGLP
jgi:acetoin utilization deacetylase AcuC-like enzyme